MTANAIKNNEREKNTENGLKTGFSILYLFFSF